MLLVVLALLATFDPWYRVIVHPRPWLGYAFFVVSIFAALNVALPLVGLPPVRRAPDQRVRRLGGDHAGRPARRRPDVARRRCA